MSFPINPTTVTAAARIATDVAGRIGEALSFDQVLHGDAAASGDPAAAAAGTDETPQDVSGWLERAVTRVRELLGGAGIPVDRPLQLESGPAGDLRVHGDHPRGGAIESVLAGDGELRRATAAFRRISGKNGFTVPPRSRAA